MGEEAEARQDALARKADTATVFRTLDLKADRSELTAGLAKKADAAQLDSIQGSYAGKDVAARLTALQAEVTSKASSKVFLSLFWPRCCCDAFASGGSCWMAPAGCKS